MKRLVVLAVLLVGASMVIAGGIAAPSAKAATRTTRQYRASCVGIPRVPGGLRARPARCVMAASPQSDLAHMANLTGLRWRAWGTSQAVATGYELGMHLPYEHVPVRVVLTRPAYVEELGVYVYMHFRVTSHYGTIAGTIQAN